jgi:hypothetical protein
MKAYWGIGGIASLNNNNNNNNYNRTLKQRDVRRLKTAEMKFMRRAAGYSLLDRRRNENVLEEIRVDSVENKLAQYKQKWFDHVSRWEDIRYPKRLLDYRNVGRGLDR